MLTEEEKNAGLEGKIIPINIEEQMKSAYIDYSMSVIVSRALPDVRDGAYGPGLVDALPAGGRSG